MWYSDSKHDRESARSAVGLYGSCRGASAGYGGHGKLVVTELRCMLSSVLVVVIAGCLLFGQGTDRGSVSYLLIDLSRDAIEGFGYG